MISVWDVKRQVCTLSGKVQSAAAVRVYVYVMCRRVVDGRVLGGQEGLDRISN